MAVPTGVGSSGEKCPGMGRSGEWFGCMKHKGGGLRMVVFLRERGM